jgi:long-chain acyl-CoA synthetase
VQQDHALSFAQVWDEAGALAGFLQQVCGVEPGDRVALMLSNRPEFVVATAAIHAIGAVQVNINPHYVARELHHQLVDPGPGRSSCRDARWRSCGRRMQTACVMPW